MHITIRYLRIRTKGPRACWWAHFSHSLLGGLRVMRATGIHRDNLDRAREFSAALHRLILAGDNSIPTRSAIKATDETLYNVFYTGVFTPAERLEASIESIHCDCPDDPRFDGAYQKATDIIEELKQQVIDERHAREKAEEQSAIDRRAREEAEQRAGVPTKPVPAWSELCAQYLKALQHRGRNGKAISPVHYRQRERHLTTHTSGKGPNQKTVAGYWEELNLDVTRIDPSVIENRKDLMKSSGDSPKTIASRIESLKALLTWCVRVGYLTTNPLVNRLEPVKVIPKVKRRRLKALELKALLRAAPAARRLVYKLAVCTAFRKAELGSRRVQDYDRETRTIFLDGQHAKNGQDARSLPLFKTVAAELEKSIRRKAPTDPLVMVPLHIDALFKQDLAKAGVKYAPGELVYHSLRRCSASILADNRASVRDQMDVMRHSDAAMTLHYTDAEEAEKMRLSEALGKAVS